MVCHVSADLISCDKCSCGKYCSLQCRGKHKEHSEYCSSICSLEKMETEKRIAGEIFSVYSEKLPYKMKKKLIRLVGERPVVNIFLDNVGLNGLWDTGAMVSVMSSQFLKDNFPNVEVRPLEEIVGKRGLEVNVANQGALSIKGVAIMEFGVEEGQGLFKIPFLITGDTLTNTIIGYNTIEHLATNFGEKINLPASLTKVIDRVSVDNVEAMVDLLQEGGKIEQQHRPNTGLNMEDQD